MLRKLGLFAATASVLMCGAAFADDRDTIIASCGEMLNLPAGGCGCIADKAMSEFNDKEFAFFMAVIGGSDSDQATTRGQLTMEEQIHVGMRMTNMPAECAGG